MRRLTTTLSLALASLLLVALPALAAGEETHAVQESGFGSGQWDGLLLGLVFAVIVGLVVFIDSYAGRDDEAAPGHDGHGH